MSKPASFCFDDFELDVSAEVLRRRGERVEVSPQALGVLARLVREAPRTVAAAELLKAGWGDTAVSSGSLRVAIHELRRILTTGSHDRARLETVRARGYRLLGLVLHEQPAVSLPEAAGSATLYGRSNELQELRASLAAARVAGRAVMLCGPSGVGKTRLAHELVAMAREQGFACIEVYAAAARQAEPLGVWTSMIAQCMQHEWSAAQAHPLTTVGAMASSAYPELAPSQVRMELFTQLSEMLFKFCAKQALVLFVDDLQYADEASLEFFGLFSRSLSRGRLLLLATCRELPAREHPTLHRAMTEFARGPANRRLQLSNLAADDIIPLLQSVAGGASSKLAYEIHKLTLGNPLFSLEVARLIACASAAGEAVLTQPGLELREVIRRRLTALSPSCRSTIAAASILGPSFTVAELASALGIGPASTLAHIDSCLDAAILVREPDGRFALPHPLIQELASAELTQAEAAALHARRAEWLEQRGAALSSAGAAQLAFHYFRGAESGVAEKALAYSRQCGERAMEAAAFASAATHFERALACGHLVEREATYELFELQIRLACARRAAGLPGGGNEVLLELASRAEALGQDELFARVTLGYTGHTQESFVPMEPQGGAGVQMRLLSRALELNTRADTRILLLCAKAWALMGSMRTQERETAAEAAVELARELGEPRLLARALQVHVYACSSPARRSERGVHFDELVHVAEQQGLQAQEVEARVARAFFWLEVGELAAARVDEHRAQLLVRPLLSPRSLARSEVPAISRAYGSGNVSEAERLAQASINCTPNEITARAFFVARSAALKELAEGASEQLMHMFEALLVVHPAATGLRCWLASVYARLGRTELARETFDLVARHDFAEVADDLDWLTCMCWLAATAVWLDDVERADVLYPKLVGYGARWVFCGGEAFPLGPVAHWLGALATTRGEREESLRWLREARLLCERVGDASVFVHRVIIAEARCLLKLGKPSEREQAMRSLSTASAFARDRKLRELELEVERVSRACGLATLKLVR